MAKNQTNAPTRNHNWEEPTNFNLDVAKQTLFSRQIEFFAAEARAQEASRAWYESAMLSTEFDRKHPLWAAYRRADERAREKHHLFGGASKWVMRLQEARKSIDGPQVRALVNNEQLPERKPRNQRGSQDAFTRSENEIRDPIVRIEEIRDRIVRLEEEARRPGARVRAIGKEIGALKAELDRLTGKPIPPSRRAQPSRPKPQADAATRDLANKLAGWASGAASA